MDVKELKNYIYDNNYIEQILESIGCHHIKFHSGNEYYSAANADGDNKNAIIIYNNEYLLCINYTRQMINSNRQTDIIDLVCYTKKLTFPQALQYICNDIGISFYHNFDEELPESFRILQQINDMDSGGISDEEKPLCPISSNILKYYKPYVNDLFYEDGIDYNTQRFFGIGYDEESNRITIPIFSSIGDLVGVKGRLFKKEIDSSENKYLYLEQCNKSRILFGLNFTEQYIREKDAVFVFESEKAVMQAWSQGIRNSVSTGGKYISKNQIEMITRLGSKIIIAFDKDVTEQELSDISERFIDGIEIYAIIDKDDLLGEHESPTDNALNMQQLIKNNIYRIR